MDRFPHFTQLDALVAAGAAVASCEDKEELEDCGTKVDVDWEEGTVTVISGCGPDTTIVRR